jgi:hypothetical protein
MLAFTAKVALSSYASLRRKSLLLLPARSALLIGLLLCGRYLLGPLVIACAAAPPAEEAIDFIHYLFAEGRPLIELIDSRTTFANHHTAKYYPQDRRRLAPYRKQKGVEVEAVANQRLELEQDTARGGQLLITKIQDLESLFGKAPGTQNG